MYIFYSIWYEHGPVVCSVSTPGEPKKRRRQTVTFPNDFPESLFLHFTTENTSLVFADFSWKELKKGGVVTAVNACLSLQICLKQQLAAVLTKATLPQERILSRKDWDLKIQFPMNFESSHRVENTRICGAEEQGLGAQHFPPRQPNHGTRWFWWPWILQAPKIHPF